MGWLVDELVGWLVSGWVGELIGGIACCGRMDGLVGGWVGFVGWLFGCLVVCLVG